MYNKDNEFASEIVSEKTDEKLINLLEKSKSNLFTWWRVVLSVLIITLVFMLYKTLNETKIGVKMINQGSDSDHYFEVKGPDPSYKTKHESVPNHKGYFMQYALDGWGDADHSTDKIMELADKIDPENSLYHYLAAGINYKNVIGKVDSNETNLSERQDFNKVIEYKILNQDAYNKALNHIKEAGDRKGIQDHISEISMEKLEKIKTKVPQGYFAKVALISEAFGVQYYSIDLINTAYILEAKFYELSRNGTIEEFMFWKDQYLKFIDDFTKHETTIIDILVAKAIIRTPLTNMRAAASHLKIDEEVKKITQLLDVLFLEKKVNNRPTRAEDLLSYSKFGYLAYLTDSPTRRQLPPDLSLGEEVSPEPYRLLEHTFFGRMMLIVSIFLTFIICISMWIFYWVKRKNKTTLPLKALSSLSLVDGCLIICGGVILPMLGYVIINEKTSLGVREWGIHSADYMLFAIQFNSMLITIFTLSALLLRLRLTKTLPEIIEPIKWQHWCLPCFSILAMILVGLSDTYSEVLPLVIAGLLLSITILTWLVTAICHCFRRSEKLPVSQYAADCCLYILLQ